MLHTLKCLLLYAKPFLIIFIPSLIMVFCVLLLLYLLGFISGKRLKNSITIISIITGIILMITSVKILINGDLKTAQNIPEYSETWDPAQL